MTTLSKKQRKMRNRILIAAALLVLVKLLRVALLLLTAAFDVWGFCLGFVGILVLLATTKPLVGHGYLYPLIPFNGKALRRLLVREPINRDNT